MSSRERIGVRVESGAGSSTVLCTLNPIECSNSHRLNDSKVSS
jgi:hypothetical protein